MTPLPMAFSDVGAIDQSPCDGCTACRHRCIADIPLTHEEFQAIRDHLARLPAEVRDPVLAQDQDVPWPGTDGSVTYKACRFLDQRNGLCLVYPVRPLVCRLLGHVEWLPCPISRIREYWKDAHLRMLERIGREKTWEEWEREK